MLVKLVADMVKTQTVTCGEVDMILGLVHYAKLNVAICPGSRIAAGAGSEPGGLGPREGSGAGGSTTLGSFRGSWMPAVWGRVMRTGVNGACEVLRRGSRPTLGDDSAAEGQGDCTE